MFVLKVMYRRDENRLKENCVVLQYAVVMWPDCHTELIKSGKQYHTGWKPIPTNYSWKEWEFIIIPCDQDQLYKTLFPTSQRCST